MSVAQYDELMARIKTAIINNSVRASREADENQTDNPSTRMHELVYFLQEIKENKKDQWGSVKYAPSQIYISW
ncbi:MAG: hypothetical protein D6B27_00325 [Gammaproteobacteria bacterium]|nr:MAG: hypothetical protein D6B27_00325 [Gammaproteobacteria bacterium]